MASSTARQKLAEPHTATIHRLDANKAKRLGGATMLIPTPRQVEEAIAAVPQGQTKTVRAIRAELAAKAGAEIACPSATNTCWRIVAQAAEEDRADGRNDVTPWWRVTRDGKPNPSLPGGAERQRELLLAEGVRI